MTATADLPFSDGATPDITDDAWDEGYPEGPQSEATDEPEAVDEAAAAEEAVAALAASSAAQQAPAGPASPPVAPGAVQGAPTAPVTALAPLGTFEGQVVHGTEITIKGMAVVETLGGVVVGIDDRIRLVGEMRCISVSHKPNKDGELVRVMVLKPANLELAPWDPADPDDDGILRARPTTP